MTRTSTILLLTLAPVLMASKCRKDPEGVDPLDEYIDISPPDVSLQVISIDPNLADENTPHRASLYGSNFESGARVYFDGDEARSVSFNSSNSLTVTAPPMPSGTFDVEVVNPSGERAVLRRGLVVRAPRVDTSSCRSMTLYFDLDSSSLSSEESGTLSAQSTCLKESGGAIRLEGHCDERGTTEYNIALGERRAQAVERYLINQGVPPSRISTISYGEERPAIAGSSESAWAKNRRVELQVVE